MLQTHTSWVFLTGRYAYKVKKPVNFGFLDYTDLSAREFFCHEELRLNRRLSPDIYLEVLPLTERRGRLRPGGAGRVVDWCLKMRELPQDAIMTERLRQGRVGFGHITEIARLTARFHAGAERGAAITRYGSSEIIKLNWDENFAQTFEFRGRTITRPAFDLVKTAVEKFIAGHRGLFRRRRDRGFVRRCHGDLHARNIFLADDDAPGPTAPEAGPETRGKGKKIPCLPEDPRRRSAGACGPGSRAGGPGEKERPASPSGGFPAQSAGVRVFDCIEFNPRFSCSDTASEIAFLAMDLDWFGRRDLAGFFVERYVAESGDTGLLELLEFYRCYRAWVRGKVTSFNLNDPGMPEAAKSEARLTARRYFKLAEAYARRLEPDPRLVVMFGLPGTGKSHVAARLAERIDAWHLNSDSIRKQLAGAYGPGSRAGGPGEKERPASPSGGFPRRSAGLDSRVSEAQKAQLYAPAFSGRVYRELLDRTRAYLAAGCRVVADATFLRADSRARAQAVADRLRVPCLFVQADCPEKTVIARMRRRSRRPSVSDADLRVYRAMKQRFTPPRPGRTLLRIDTRRPVAQSVTAIERALLHL